MTSAQLWQEFIASFPEAKGAKYEAWPYGSDNPGLLLELTLSGTKTATASAYPLYLNENCPVPKKGDYSVILNSDNEAKCVIRNTSVTIVPFCDVSSRHAFLEGEGDRSLEFWQRVHEEVFTVELKEAGLSFSRDMPVVLEEFEVLFQD